MLIAKKTKEDNIAEYVIYMFQIEDLIRAHDHDIELIHANILEPQIEDEELRAKYRDWYISLIKSMKRDGVMKSGHIGEIQEILMELLMLHNTLLNMVQEKRYQKVFEAALPVLKEFQAKSESSDINLVEVGFNALYGKILLRLKGKEISESSEQGFKVMSDLLGHLAAYYKKMKKGELDFSSN